MSNTPRVDAARLKTAWQLMDAEEGAKLERELVASEARVKELEEALRNIQIMAPQEYPAIHLVIERVLRGEE